MDDYIHYFNGLITNFPSRLAAIAKKYGIKLAKPSAVSQQQPEADSTLMPASTGAVATTSGGKEDVWLISQHQQI